MGPVGQQKSHAINEEQQSASRPPSALLAAFRAFLPYAGMQCQVEAADEGPAFGTQTVQITLGCSRAADCARELT